MNLASIFSPEVVAALEEFIDERVAMALEGRAARSDDGWPMWMGVAQASNYLGCSEERVRKLVARGHLPYSQERPGARIFLARRDLDQAMTEWRSR